ncbi:MAG: hypothetical protein HY548_00630 [Elusimicrobia bacterium]|nr:hypothetical protein [Elusimicrobiota bacterium]
MENAPPIIPSRRWWALGALLLGWISVLSWWVEGDSFRSEKAHFLERGRVLLRHYAAAFSDVLTVEDALLAQAYVQRLAGEEYGRYAVLTDRKGTVVASAGALPTGAGEEERLREALAARDFTAIDVPESPPSMEWSQPVWVRSKKWGVLRWGVWTSPLEESRKRNRRRLVLTSAWAALAGGLAICVFARLENGGK